MAKFELVSGKLIRVDTASRRLTLEKSVIFFPFLPEIVEYNYSFDIDENWIIEHLNKSVELILKDGVVIGERK